MHHNLLLFALVFTQGKTLIYTQQCFFRKVKELCSLFLSLSLCVWVCFFFLCHSTHFHDSMYILKQQYKVWEEPYEIIKWALPTIIGQWEYLIKYFYRIMTTNTFPAPPHRDKRKVQAELYPPLSCTDDVIANCKS